MIKATIFPEPKGVECFNAHDSLHTGVKTLELAKELGLDVQEKSGGLFWIAFVQDGKPIINMSFYHPSHAYAFLLGVKAGRAQ